MITPDDIVKAIDSDVNQYAKDITPIQKALFNKVTIILKDLSVDAEGNIAMTASNLKILNKVNATLSGIVNDEKFQYIISDVKISLDDVEKNQTKYYKDIADISAVPPVINELHKQAFEDTVENMTGAGINENVVKEAVDLVADHIKTGSSFIDMNEKLKDFMLGNKDVPGKLESYSKQIISDSLHQTARTYNSIMSDKLQLEFFQYVGALSEDSRPLCKALVKKQWLHKSEITMANLKRLASEYAKKAPMQGVYPTTTKETFVNDCGGYNCPHHCVPTPSEFVPAALRKKFEQKK